MVPLRQFAGGNKPPIPPLPLHSETLELLLPSIGIPRQRRLCSHHFLDLQSGVRSLEPSSAQLLAQLARVEAMRGCVRGSGEGLDGLGGGRGCGCGGWLRLGRGGRASSSAMSCAFDNPFAKGLSGARLVTWARSCLVPSLSASFSGEHEANA